MTYGEPEDALKWLWKFVDGAKSAGELYGRTLVVFACEHYANQLALPNSQRRGSVLPRSHRDSARKAFEKLTKAALPGSHRELTGAIEREARSYRARVAALEQHARAAATATDDVGEQPDVDLVDGRRRARRRGPRRATGGVGDQGGGNGRPPPRPGCYSGR